METRFRRYVCEKACSVPPEVWQLIVSFLDPTEAVRTALVCSDFASISTPAAQQACRRLWPQHGARLTACGPSGVQRFLRLVQAHEEELAAHPDVEKAKAVQKVVLPEHRQIAVEWLIEVSWDWQLESTVVYRGTQYLDHYLAVHAVPALGKFQMLAISCLRTALKHSSRLSERERQRLPCKHWSEVTDGACTEAEVRSTCAKLERMLHQQERSHPNAKQRLRYLWYRLFDAGTVKQEHVFIYMLASFLLHLSLLDSNLSAITPTKLATTALSLSLRVFGFPAMPAVLAAHCFYTEDELLEVQKQLERAQEEHAGNQLRHLWLQSYSYSGTSVAQQPAYTLLQQIVTACGKLRFLAPAQPSSDNNLAALAAAATAAAPSATDAAAQGLAAAAPDAAIDAAAAAGQGAHRVMTRSAAAAGLASTQPARKQQQAASGPVAAAASAAAGGPAAPEHGHAAGGVGSSSQAGSSSGWAVPPPHDEHLAATPRRPAVSAGHAVPPMAPLPDFAAMAAAAGQVPAVTPPAAAAAGDAAAQAEAPRTGQQQQPPGSAGGSARRCATRELPPRRAVAVSRYGMLASRSSNGTPARGGAQAEDGPSSSKAIGAGDTSNAAAAAHQRTDGATAGHAGIASAAAGPSRFSADGAGPSSFLARPAAAAAAAGPPAGSMTPASPKHAAAGTRGLAALFAGVTHGCAGNSQAGVGSNTGRLLSGLPSLQHKLNMSDGADLQHQLSDEPLWLWPLQQAEAAGFRSDASKAAANASNGANMHVSSVPVLRSARRSAAAPAVGGGAGEHELLQKAHKVHDRPGVHTRSSSGGSGDATSSHWHATPGGAARASQHAVNQG